MKIERRFLADPAVPFVAPRPCFGSIRARYVATILSFAFAVAGTDGAEAQGARSVWHFTKLWQLSATTHEFMTSENLKEADVASDGDGNVYVLSHEAVKVFVVSESGELIDSIGRRGSGPGELSNPGAIDVAEGVLHVFDHTGGVRRWRISDLELLPRLAMGEYFSLSGRFRGMGSRFLASEAVWNGSEGGGDRWERYLAEWNRGGKERIAAGPRSVYTPFESPACIAGVVMPRIFEASLVWDYADGLLVIASDTEYRAELLRDRQSVGQIRRDAMPRRVTRAMLRREVGDLRWGPPGNPCVIAAEQVIDGRGYAEFLAPIADVLISPNEEVWVLRGRVKDEPTIVDIFRTTGDFIGTLPAGSPFPVAFVGPDRILTIGSDEFGSTLEMYRLERR